MQDFPKISPMGDRGILIEFEDKICPETLNKVLFYKNRIQNFYIKEKVEVINTYNSILISYMYTIEDVYSDFSSLESLLKVANIPKNTDSKVYNIPVCYDPEFGPDLEQMATQKNLEIDEIIRMHTAPFYLLYFIGFLPGFLYLGGLNEKLEISRKETPRKSVEKGSVGIGEKQTGIYPKSSPGGWQILGRSPVNFFDENHNPPSPFSAGDRIKFYPVSKQEFFQIKEAVEKGDFNLKTEKYEG